MRIVSIDPSFNSCGIVVRDCGFEQFPDMYQYYILKPHLTKKEISCPLINYLSYGVYKELNQKLIHFIEVLQNLLKQLNPVMIQLEDVPFVSGSRSTVDLAILSGAIRCLCIQNDIVFATVNNMTWKKEMLGNGASDKDLTVMCFKKLNPLFKDYSTKTINDIADAYFLANYPRI